MNYYDYNPMKILFYSKQLEKIGACEIPDPIMLEVDPCNFCNFSCSWCSSGFHLFDQEGKCKRNKYVITEGDFKSIVDFVEYKKSVKGIYWCGGGEPTLNIHLSKLMKIGKEIGVNNYITTNGSNLLRFGENLIDLCKWVAVSVNSGSEEQWKKLFRTNMSYEKYLEGCKVMNKYNRNTRIIEVVYKHTFDPNTYIDIEKSYELAIELGFTHVLIKPVDMFIYERNYDEKRFSEVWSREKIEHINQMIENIKRKNKENSVINLDCGGFYGDISKANEIKPHTRKCWVCMLNPVFGATGDIYICCVRRSEKNVGRWDKNLKKYWGSREHKEKVWGFNPNRECPNKCKNKQYNKIVEDMYINSEFSLGHI